MARPKADTPTADAIRVLLDAEGRVSVRATPGARVESLAVEGARLVAKVRAKPQDGAANAAIRALVARALGVAKSRVVLLRGATSREKVLQIG